MDTWNPQYRRARAGSEDGTQLKFRNRRTSHSFMRIILIPCAALPFASTWCVIFTFFVQGSVFALESLSLAMVRTMTLAKRSLGARL